ncbi:MAG: rane-associated protein in eicosanoid and glutathione metabolism [Proteobacteria bacterium]|nr:rane-associated protein in eicosanoid and glutathione metabolism [Pseudomonadota bacterium]
MAVRGLLRPAHRHRLTATAFGALWLVGRVWYAAAYLRAPKTRGGGFVLAFAAWGGLMIAASWGVLQGLLAR